jgi:hypothetical protein
VLKAIAEQSKNISDAIIRLNISLPAEHEGLLRDNDIGSVLAEAHYFAIAKDIRRETRLRLGKWTAEEITPREALKAYLESKKVPPERAKILLQYGQKLIQGQRTEPG